MMKMKTGFPEDTLPSLEEGSLRNNDNKTYFLNRIKRNSSCSQFVQIVKVILYLELIFFTGWIGCVILSNHIRDNNYNRSKSETILALRSSAMKFAPFNISNRINYESGVTGDRYRRNIEDKQLKRNTCERNVNSIREKVNQLTKQFVVGEASDLTVTTLRENCRLLIVDLMFRVIITELNSETYTFNPTDEELHTLAFNIKQEIVNKTDAEHRQQIEASGPPTQEIVNELRNTIGFMIRDFKNCEKILPLEISAYENLADLLNDYRKCERAPSTLIEDLRSSQAQIVPGNSSDPTIIQLRESVESITIKLALNLIVKLKYVWTGPTYISGHLENIPDEDWQNYTVSIKQVVMMSADSEHRAKIEESNSSMQETINILRNIINNYLTTYENCIVMEVILTEVRRYLRDVHPRTKRHSEVISEENCWIDEPDTTLLEERQVRDNAFRNEHLTLSLLSFGMMSTTLANQYLANATTERRAEFAKLLFDMYYELQKLTDEDAEWAEYAPNFQRNLTDSLTESDNKTIPESMFSNTVKLGKAMNLHYRKVEERKNVNDIMKPTFGRLIYLDEKPEKSGLRKIRHILNGIIRLYFKLFDPSSLMCKPGRELQKNPTLYPPTAT